MADREPLIVTPEDTPPIRTTEVSSRPAGRKLIGTIFTILAIIVAAFLLVLAARWAYHKVHHSSVYVQPANTKQLPVVPSSSNTQSGNKTVANSSSNQSKNLPNSGPGSVAAVFVASSAIAGSAHYVMQLRRNLPQ